MYKRIIALILSTCFVITSFPVMSFADETIEIPEPLKVVDFSYSFNELSKQDEEFEVVNNAASPSLVEDDEMGQVLKLGKAVIKDRKFVSYTDEENGTSSLTGMIESENSEYSTINISNPFAGADHLVEYAPYEDVKTTMYGNCQQPLWEEGITISYWIKTPKGTDGLGLNSNVLGFTSERFQIQVDDYARYLCTVKFDLDYSKYTEAEKETLGIGISGVDEESDFYYQLAEGRTYNNKPLYDYETLGRIYWMNKNFVNGYVEYDDGTIKACEEVNLINTDINYYNYYSEKPYLGVREDDHNPRTSNLRYAWTYSEMWLDASSSFYFENDNNKTNKQLNPNSINDYGKVMGMQDYDSFNINSWKKHSNVADAYMEGYAADSPVLEPGEWHYVTVIIQNDWVRYFFDGKEIDIEENYSSFGLAGLPRPVGGYQPWKRFNKGTGSRYGYGSHKTRTYWCYYGNYCSPTIMEWITLDCVDLTIGGGNRNGDGYFMYADTDEILIKNIVFYDQMLTDEQIKVLAEEPEYYEGFYPYLGDANADKKISARDALLVLKHSAKLEELEETEHVDVNSDGNVNSEDALLILEYAAEMIDSF